VSRELLDARLPLAASCSLQSQSLGTAEQDHLVSRAINHQQLRGAIFFERKFFLLVPCQHTQEKKQGAARIISFKKSQYRRFLPV
jgi:hypothetical protein